jgi:hypothetical protein
MNAINPLSRFTVPVSFGNVHADPLSSTSYAVEIRGGLAFVELVRSFRNTEKTPIEAILVFPVPTSATVTGMTAKVGDRSLSGIAQEKKEAEKTYEAAVDEGRTAVLHAEVIKGLHRVSVSNIGPETEVAVTIRFVAPLSFDPEPQILIPTTVSDVYGAWNVEEVDRPQSDANIHKAKIVVSTDAGTVSVCGIERSEAEVGLTAPIVVSVAGSGLAPVVGRMSDGRPVRIAIERATEARSDFPLDVDLLVDRSGSMGSTRLGEGTLMQAVQRSLRDLGGFAGEDRLRLSAFDHGYDRIGSATGEGIPALLARMPGHQGSTEIGHALTRLMAEPDCGDNIVLVTDGRSNRIDFDEAARKGRRIHVVLVGGSAFDQQLSYLASRTGGHVMVTSGVNLAKAFRTGLDLSCLPSDDEETDGEGNRVLRIWRGGALVKATILPADVAEGSGDEIGAYVAGILADRATDRETAVALSVANGIVGLWTSLVLVDAEGAVQSETSLTRKSSLSWSDADMSVGMMRSAMSFSSMSAAPMGVLHSMASTRSASPRKASKSIMRSFHEAPGSDVPLGIGFGLDTTAGGWVGGRSSGDVPYIDKYGTGTALPGGDIPMGNVFVVPDAGTTIDWSGVVVSFADFTVAGILPAARKVLEAKALLVAAATGLDAARSLVVVVALAAEAETGNRVAERIARRARGMIGDEAFGKAVVALGGRSVAA